MPSKCRAAAKLAMCADGRRLSMTNVFLHEYGRLTCADYNSILVEFYLRFLHSAASEAGLAIELSSDERSFEEAFAWAATRRLKQFSALANKSIAHPADRDRWMDFLIQLHCQSNRDYDFGLLAKWLIEDGWSRRGNRRTDL